MLLWSLPLKKRNAEAAVENSVPAVPARPCKICPGVHLPSCLLLIPITPIGRGSTKHTLLSFQMMAIHICRGGVRPVPSVSSANERR